MKKLSFSILYDKINVRADHHTAENQNHINIAMLFMQFTNLQFYRSNG